MLKNVGQTGGIFGRSTETYAEYFVGVIIADAADVGSRSVVLINGDF
jgi:hypothetical protein